MTNTKEYMRNYYRRNRKHSDMEILSNFKYITSKYDDPRFLTTVGFNEVSKFTHMQTIHMLKTGWCELLKQHNLIERLYSYILNEYKQFIQNGDSNVGNFIKLHHYITQDLLKYFKSSKLKEDCGLNIRGSSDELYKNNFLEVVEKLKSIPTYTEFLKESKISPQSYYRRYTNNWDDIVRIFIDDENLLNQFEVKKEKILLSNVRLGSKARVEKYGYSEKKLKDNFTKVFNECFELYGTYPTRRFFNIRSEISDVAYRKRYKVSWSKICEMYGFPIENKNVAERIVLESIKKILNVDYEPQKTWDWLIGIGGKNMFCDGYFADINLVVEFDGVQHRKPVENLGGVEAYEKRVKNDEQKDRLLKENKIRLLRIDSREPWHEEQFLRSILQKNKII